MNFSLTKYSMYFQDVGSSKCAPILGIGIAHLNSSSVVEKAMPELAVRFRAGHLSEAQYRGNNEEKMDRYGRAHSRYVEQTLEVEIIASGTGRDLTRYWKFTFSEKSLPQT